MKIADTPNTHCIMEPDESTPAELESVAKAGILTMAIMVLLFLLLMFSIQ